MSAADVPADPPRFPTPAPPRAARPSWWGRARAFAVAGDHGDRRGLVVGAFVAWIPIAAAVVVMTGLVYLTAQQSLRSGANDPQLAIAGDVAARLSGGAPPAPLLGSVEVDLATSLSPYTIVFDDQGRPVASTGALGGRTPTPPPGVLRAARARRTEITWQPEDGVRSAIVVVPFRSASASGTVLVGRSLTEVERREALMGYIALASLVGGLGLTAAACLVAAWLRRRLADA